MAEGRRHARLGDLTLRLDPDSITYPYKIDYSVIDTLGGQVIQVLGATTGDLVITGSFGQDHPGKKESWELAEEFHYRIKDLMDRQTDLTQGRGHRPIPFTYFDGTHDWNFQVLIKGISDPDAGQGSIDHTTGKISYRYQLTLFIVQDNSLKLKKIATDKFISRIANGMGWKPSGFNGANSTADAIAFIQKNSGDGTFSGFIEKELGFTDTSTSGSSSPPVTGKGGSPSANQALGKQYAAQYGWDTGNEWDCLVKLWNKESGWSNTADTRKTGSGGDGPNSAVFAYGIAQARPATKYPKPGQPPDLGGQSDAATQIQWGLKYISETYGSASAAWAHEVANNWY